MIFVPCFAQFSCGSKVRSLCGIGAQVSRYCIGSSIWGTKKFGTLDVGVTDLFAILKHMNADHVSIILILRVRVCVLIYL